MIIPVKTSLGGYDIYLERGAIGNIGKFLKLDRKVLVVTDSGVPSEYSKTVAEQCKEAHIVTVPQGESSKSFENYKMLLSKMVEYSFTRSDCVIAVGGGVVGDLSGFAAASFMRGIDFYNVPTTVLSQVDSSIGGKVAIDFEGYKNIVGAFYPPKAVVIDPNTLSTLSKRHISNGLSEAVKMAVTFDRELFSLFENGDVDENIDKIIESSLRIKKNVVENDERESGLRKVLNFGHTLAHAIESANNMQELYHGECVALGMIPMCSNEVRERLVKVLEKLQLPTVFKCDKQKFLEAMSHDKKMDGSSITVVFSPEIGEFQLKTLDFEDFKKEISEVVQ